MYNELKLFYFCIDKVKRRRQSERITKADEEKPITKLSTMDFMSSNSTSTSKVIESDCE